MEKREKVIKGLECCITDNCNECPYDTNFECPVFEPTPNELLMDALELLKAQAPRVLTLDEYRAMAEKPRNERTPVWTEWRDGGNRGWYIPQRAYDTYGVMWRAWTDKPTRKQMEAEAW